MKLTRIPWLSLLLTQAILLSGCTAALWEEDRFARYHQPATPSNLELYHSADTDDILVHYDEKREGSKRTSPHAYWLRGDGEPASNPYKPHFVPVKEAHPLAAIPIIETTNAIPPRTDLHAVPGANAHDFTLFAGQNLMGHFELPEYVDTSGKTKQVLLTPLAIMVDAVIVAAVVAVVAAPYYLDDSECWE